MNNLVQKLSNLCSASIEAKFVASFVTKKRHFVQIVVTGQFSKFFVDAIMGLEKRCIVTECTQRCFVLRTFAAIFSEH